MNELQNEEIVTETLQTDENSASEQEIESEDKSENFDKKPSEESASVDYGQIVIEDLNALKRLFPELRGMNDISELDNPLRYGALRDLGLTPEEAYLATRKRRVVDNRSHLYPSPSVSAGAANTIPESDMNIAREIFGDISDAEIRKLYKKVTK